MIDKIVATVIAGAISLFGIPHAVSESIMQTAATNQAVTLPSSTSASAEYKGSAGNVLAFGADPSGVNDSTQAFRAAIATGQTVYVPTGTYKITDMLSLGGGQTMEGDGRTQSIIKIDSSFNKSALGVVRLGIFGKGASLFDIAISFSQPDVSSRSGVVHYPPAVYAVDAARFQMDRVRIAGAWDGVNATGNAGGANIGHLEIGALHKGLIFDGAKDFVNIESVECWPFDFAAKNLYSSVYADGTTVCAEFGRVDGLSVGSLDSFRTQINFTSNAGPANSSDGSGIAARISRIGLDGNSASVNIANGNVLIGSMYSTKANDTQPTFTQTSGNVSIGNISIVSSLASGSDISVTGGSLRIVAGTIRFSHLSLPVMTISGSSAAYISGITFKTIGSGGKSTSPIVKQSGSQSKLVFTNNVFAGSVPSNGTIFGIDSSISGNYIQGNQYNDWNTGLVMTTSSSANSGTFDTPILLRQQSRVQGTGGQIQFASSYGVSAGIKGYLQNGSGPAGGILFQTRSTSGDLADRMFINYAGNVGIGTIAPSYKLQVHGIVAPDQNNVYSLGSPTYHWSALHVSHVYADDVQSQKLCLTDTGGMSCYTRAQLDKVFAK